MPDTSLGRLYALRALYGLIAVGIAINEWPEILSPSHDLDHLNSIVRAVLGAVSLLAALGIRYPLKMLPLLLFELLWKLIWLIFYGLPLWQSNRLDAPTRGTFYTCLISVVLVPLVVPWRYFVHNYLKVKGDRWTRLLPG